MFLVLAFLAESVTTSYDALQVERHCRGFRRNCTSVQHNTVLAKVLWLAVLCISVSCEICAGVFCISLLFYIMKSRTIRLQLYLGAKSGDGSGLGYDLSELLAFQCQWSTFWFYQRHWQKDLKRGLPRSRIIAIIKSRKNMEVQKLWRFFCGIVDSYVQI